MGMDHIEYPWDLCLACREAIILRNIIAAKPILSGISCVGRISILLEYEGTPINTVCPRFFITSSKINSR